MLGGLKQNFMCTGTQSPQKDWARPAFECLSVSYGGTGQQWPAAATGALGVATWDTQCVAQALLEEVAISPTTELLSRRPTNCRTIYQRNSCTVKKESSRTHNRFPNLGIQQRYWEPPENLTLEASGIWWQNVHRNGETDSWRAQTKPFVHQEPGERSYVPTRDWARLGCECPGSCSRGVSRQWPAVGSGALNTIVSAYVLLKEVAIMVITPTIVWPQAKQQGGNTAHPSTEN